MIFVRSGTICCSPRSRACWPSSARRVHAGGPERPWLRRHRAGTPGVATRSPSLVPALTALLPGLLKLVQPIPQPRQGLGLVVLRTILALIIKRRIGRMHVLKPPGDFQLAMLLHRQRRIKAPVKAAICSASVNSAMAYLPLALLRCMGPAAGVRPLPLGLLLRLPGRSLPPPLVALRTERSVRVARPAHDTIEDVAFRHLNLLPALGTQPRLLVMRAAQLREERRALAQMAPKVLKRVKRSIAYLHVHRGIP